MTNHEMKKRVVEIQALDGSGLVSKQSSLVEDLLWDFVIHAKREGEPEIRSLALILLRLRQ